MVLRPLPVEDPHQLISIPTWDQNFRQRITPEQFRQPQRDRQSVQALASRMTIRGIDVVSVDGITDEWSVTYATADIFSILRLSTAIGRVWTLADEARGETDVAVLG